MTFFGRSRVVEAASTEKLPDIVGWAQTDTGRVRERNEDAVFFGRPAADRDFGRSGALAMVADGMGGANGGSVASGIVSEEVPEVYLASKHAPPKALRLALESANRRIHRLSLREEGLTGMGSTCVALVMKPPFAWAAWVGDSRLYLIRGNQIFQMTEDHSWVNEMVRRGMLTREEARNHEDRNFITRALGSHPKVEVDVWAEPYPVRKGDRFVLCSDGLHDLLGSSDILEIAGTGSVDAAGSRLIREANARGGFDNISAVLVELVEPESKTNEAVRPTRAFRPEEIQEMRCGEGDTGSNSTGEEVLAGCREVNLELSPRIES
jgi:serine/threonine protein phosphatase PrpC